jgi:hypothetical protein
VASFVSRNFLPVRFHIKEQPAAFERFSARWTPTIVVMSPEGVERRRVEGYLPAEDFLAELEVGLGHEAFAAKQWAEAEKHFRQVVEQYPQSASAPEALYWAGVARYKSTGNAAALGETAAAFKQEYQDTQWAKKASVWAK